MDRVSGPNNIVMRLCNHVRRNRECGCSDLCDEAITEIKDCRAERDALRNMAREITCGNVTAEASRELRILSASGVNLSSLARLLGVDASTVARAVNGDSWAALGDEAGENDAASGPIGAGETPVSAADASSGGRPCIQAATPAPSPAEPPRWTSVSWSDLQRLAEIAVLEARDDAARHVATGVMCSYPYVAEAAVERWRNTRKEGA